MRRLLLALPTLAAIVHFAGCGDDQTSSAPSTPDASVPTADATADRVEPPIDAAGDVTTDTGAGSDADAGIDSGPQFDDAGCPIGTVPISSAADAGIPSTGIALWLRADIGVATVDGGSVCRWDDVSGNGRSFRPATVTPPVAEAAGLNAKPAVSFSGPNQHLSRADLIGIGATSGRTIAVIGATSDTTHRFSYFIQGEEGTAGTYFSLDQNTFNTAGSREGVYVTNNAYDSDLATTTATRTHVFSISSFAVGGALPNVLTYAVDGTARTLARTSGGLGNGTVESFTNANFTAIGTANPDFTGMKIGELIIYDRELTAPERLAVEQYFGARFP
jgi:hypothetical protein